MSFFTVDEPQLFPKSGTAIVSESIIPMHCGRVKFQASYWSARVFGVRCSRSLLPNELVQVVGRCGITLLVRPYEATID